MNYVIRNKKYGTYYSKYLLGIKHFSPDIYEAMKFHYKKEANLAFRLFKNKDKFEIVKVAK